MSGTFEVRPGPTITIRWKVNVPLNRVSRSNPEFQFGNSKYRLCTCTNPGQEIFLWCFRPTEAVNPSVPASVTVHVENIGQIVPSLSRTEQNPSGNTPIWSMKCTEIQKEIPDFFRFPELTFIVTFQAKELVTDEKSVQTSLCIDPIPCSDSLSEDLEKLLEMDSDSEPDVQFQCDGHCIKAHRLVVKARSPVFAKMLQSQMVEGETGVVKIEDMDLHTLKVFVRYLYRGRLDEEPTFELAMALYEAADKYEVRSLARRCAHSLILNLKVENACYVLAVADAHSDEEFVEEVTIFILENKMPISEDGPWLAFGDSHPKLAIKIYRRFCKMVCKRIRCTKF